MESILAWKNHDISLVGAGHLPLLLVYILHVAFLARAVAARVHHLSSLVFVEVFQTDEAIKLHGKVQNKIKIINSYIIRLKSFHSIISIHTYYH